MVKNQPPAGIFSTVERKDNGKQNKGERLCGRGKRCQKNCYCYN